jgi:hypothetical protein
MGAKMNVKDIIAPSAPSTAGDIAQEILDRQEMLENHYWKLEGRPSLVQGCETRDAQVWIKDFLWRITEELGETLEARDEAIVNFTENYDKIREELADTLHFIAGLSIISDTTTEFIRAFIDYYKTPANYSQPEVAMIMRLGQVGNTLKMKPWKQTDVPTDVPRFRRAMYDMLRAFLDVTNHIGVMDMAQVFDFYWRKSEVNLFRIRSKY